MSLNMSQTKLHVYSMFSGLSASLPFGNSVYYKRASELALSLVGPSGRTGSDSEEEIFYLETVEQLDALFNLQRQPKIKRLVLAERAEEDDDL